jgi:hypothetical protein
VLKNDGHHCCTSSSTSSSCDTNNIPPDGCCYRSAASAVNGDGNAHLHPATDITHPCPESLEALCHAGLHADVRSVSGSSQYSKWYGLSYCSASSISGPAAGSTYAFGSGGANRLQSYELKLAEGGANPVPPGRIGWVTLACPVCL